MPPHADVLQWEHLPFPKSLREFRTKKLREQYVTRISPDEYRKWLVLWKSDAPPGGAANAH